MNTKIAGTYSHKTRPDEINQHQYRQLLELIRFARTSSPYYRELYCGVPDKIESIRQLPVTNKKDLMAHFDDWVTDPDITQEKAIAFIQDLSLVGMQFLGKYHVAITSGTTGELGIFITDRKTTAISAKINQRAKLSWLGIGGLIKLAQRGFRLAAITATGGHFGFFSGIHYMQKNSPSWNNRIKTISVHMPINEMVEQLNKFQPTIIMGYASIIAMLASQKEQGNLHINPLLIEVMSEKLSDLELQRIGKVFNIKPYQMYGSTEIPFASSICTNGWYHIDQDIIILEPVDTKYQPVPPGCMSYTVLVTNLVSKVQPIIRYDLGDSLLVKPEACSCGNPHPAIRVEGRSADLLGFTLPDGRLVNIPPLLFVTLIDHIPGIEFFQIVQTGLQSLSIRLGYQSSYSIAQQDHAWKILTTELSAMLKSHGLDYITLERAAEKPQQSNGGKFRLIIPLS